MFADPADHIQRWEQLRLRRFAAIAGVPLVTHDVTFGGVDCVRELVGRDDDGKIDLQDCRMHQ